MQTEKKIICMIYRIKLKNIPKPKNLIFVTNKMVIDSQIRIIWHNDYSFIFHELKF
jgi:hypothetical protein